MGVTEVFAGIAVAEIDSAREWYERLIGRPAHMLPNDNEAAWQLAGHGWVYLVGDAQRAGNALLTLLVDDLDAQLATWPSASARRRPRDEADPSPPA